MKLEDLPNNKHKRFFQAAYMAALCSSGVGRDGFRHGCVITYKKNILIARHNEFKTHPKCLMFSTWAYLHAEANAILHLGLNECKDTNMYVLRIMKNDHIGTSKPCSSCEKLIKYSGIRHIFFTTYEGCEKL